MQISNGIRRIKAKYLKLPESVKASVWYTISNIIQQGIALISTPIFTRIMSTDQYGQYTVFQSWYSIITIFATLNLYAGVCNNGLVKWPDKRKQFISSLQGLSTTITAILFCIYLLGMNLWNTLLELNTFYIMIMFVQLFFVPAYNFWSVEQRFDYKYKKLILITIAMGVLSPIIGVISVIFSDYKAEARVLSFALVQICIGLFFYIYNFNKGKKYFDKVFWRFALAFNIPLIPHYLSNIILGQSDRIMISRLIGTDQAAVYSVAYTISMMFSLVINAINSSYTPYTYKALKNKQYSSLKKNTSILILLASISCFFVMALGPEIIRLFAAEEYYEARKVVPPVAMSLLFMFITGFIGTVEFFYEETKIIMAASSIAAAVNIGLNYIFIPKFGFIAAAYTTLACYLLALFSHYVACRVLLRHKGNGVSINTIYDVKLIISISIVCLIAMFGMILIYDIYWARYIIVAIIIGLFVIFRNRIIKILSEIRGK